MKNMFAILHENSLVLYMCFLLNWGKGMAPLGLRNQ